MRFILVLVMFGVMMDVGGLESCFGKIQEEAGVNPDEMQGFIKGLSSEPGGVVSNIGDMANVLTKVKVLTKQGKSAEEVQAAIQPDLESLAGESSTIENNKDKILVSVGTYVDNQNQVNPSVTPAQNCPPNFTLKGGRQQRFSKLEGLGGESTARQILPQIPTNQLQCIPSGEIIKISPQIIKEVAPGLASMATSLREDHLKSISNKKIEYAAKKKKVETISNEIATSLDQFDNKIDLFMKDWKAFAAVDSSRSDRTSDRTEKLNELSNAGTKSGTAYAVIYNAIDTNLKQLTAVMKGISSWSEGEELEKSKKSVDELFNKIPRGDLQEIDTSDGGYAARVNGKTELERIADNIKNFKDKKSEITRLMKDVIDYLEEKINKMSEKITELESEITELKTDTDKKS